jgi:hypothetical protein
MNKPGHPTPPFAAASPPYELDGYGWAMAQARLIEERRFDQIDWDNVAEEIRDMGSNIQSKAESALRLIMMHILKWQYQPERRSRSWASTIRTQRVHYRQVLRRNPGLKGVLEEMRSEAYELARVEAEAETGLPLSTFPEEPLDWATILDAPFDYAPE